MRSDQLKGAVPVVVVGMAGCCPAAAWTAAVWWSFAVLVRVSVGAGSEMSLGYW
ncbi:MAG: hypothetical protein WAU30_01475 [Propionicimonas sp.]